VVEGNQFIGKPLADKESVCFEVALALPVAKTFHYRVPDHLLSRAKVGCRILAPFRSRKVNGYILERVKEDPGQELKDILEVLDTEPLFHENLVPFFRWMADYYLYPIGRFIQAALPAGLNTATVKAGRLTDKGISFLGTLPADSEEREVLNWVHKNPGKRLPKPLHKVYALEKRGWLVTDTVSKKTIGPLMRAFVRAKSDIDLKAFIELKEGTFRAKNELEFLRTLAGCGALPRAELHRRFHNGSYLVDKWIRNGLLESYRAPVIRNPSGGILFPAAVPEDLHEGQEKVLEVIKENLRKKCFLACLVHGVTGSGKTEVYLQAIQYAIGLGGRAILMVPEIALAFYVESIFRYRMDSHRIAAFHSGLSRGERYDQWVRMARGEIDLVIGARSALYAPLPQLSLIVVDEEYDGAYKQEEAPKYQARDGAVVRGKIEQALVILGAGSPSVQSYHNADTGKYHLLSMPDRIEKRPLPEVTVVDMKNYHGGGRKECMISPILKEAVEQNLADREQVILFLNRRGFNRAYFCRSCGQPVQCANCDLALTYHLKDHCLACHYCGFCRKPQDACPSCGCDSLRPYGFGTQKLEQVLKELFPESRIVRLDRDSTRRKGESTHILKAFSNGEIDIMVGTQMVTKGYDFPNVTLVGVIAADLSLWFPDFRAAERTFQLLSQVSGRAGRGDKKGRVIVQTFNPDHYAVIAARTHDYLTFFEQEKALRKQLGYPPFCYLACVRIQGNQQEATAGMVRKLGWEMEGMLRKWPSRGKEVQVLGPAEAPLRKLKGKYRWQILLKSKSQRHLHYFLEKMEGFSAKMLQGSGVTVTIDIDPYTMM
jgi:primosomal protein N' (replication factor Y)